jgi:nucleoside-diphosphate-sugar epimerase
MPIESPLKRSPTSDEQEGRTAAITGAYGYLGALIRARLRAEGWRTLALVRAPRPDDPFAEHFDLAGDVSPETFRSVQLLVHCAYDSTLVHRDQVDRINVEGSRRLIGVADDAGVARLIVLSSMSAYPGTTQIYGQAKLAIEGAAEAVGGCCVRPGVVYGEQPRGMAGALRRITRLPVVPVLAGAFPQYLVHEDDFVSAISSLANAPTLPAGPISITHPTPVPIRVILDELARSQGRRCRFLPVPWQVVYAALRAGERLGLRMPFRADSLTGLVWPAPRVVGLDALTRLGVSVRPFALAGPQPS